LAGTSVPANCAAGTFRNITGATDAGGCFACTTGKYSFMTTGLTASDCPACPANAYCATPLNIAQCPPNTNSSTGSSSLLHCICRAGYRCTYAKKISLVVTISNCTVADFTNNVNGIQVKFKEAVALATNVSVTQVNITRISQHIGRRRRNLLSHQPSQRRDAQRWHVHRQHHSHNRLKPDEGQTARQVLWPLQQESLDIAAVIQGAHEIVALDQHLSRASIKLLSGDGKRTGESDRDSRQASAGHHEDRFEHADVSDGRGVRPLLHQHYHELFVARK
jgi:hypothetical protein